MPTPAQDSVFVEPTSSASAAVAVTATSSSSTSTGIVTTKASPSAAALSRITSTTPTHLSQQQQQQHHHYYDVKNNQQQLHQHHQHLVLDSSTLSQHQQQQLQRIVQHRRMSISTRGGGVVSSSSGGGIINTTTIGQKYVVKHTQPTSVATGTTTTTTTPTSSTSVTLQPMPHLLRNATNPQSQQNQHVTSTGGGGGATHSPHAQQLQMLHLNDDSGGKNTNSSSGGGGTTPTSNARNIMVSTSSGEVLNHQIYKIVSTDGTTGNMILDSLTPTPNNSKVLLNNVTVLSKPTTSSPAASSSSSSSPSLNSSGQQHHHVSTANFLTKQNFTYVPATAANISKQQKYTLTAGGGGNNNNSNIGTAGVFKTNTLNKTTVMGTTFVQQQQQHQQQQSTQIVQKVNISPRLASRISSHVPTTGNTLHHHHTHHQQQQQHQQHAQIFLQSSAGSGGSGIGIQHKYITTNRTSPQIIKRAATTTTTTPTMTSKVVATTTAAAAASTNATGTMPLNNNNNTNKNTITLQQQQQTQNQNVKTFITQQNQQQQQQQNALYKTQNNKSKFLKQYSSIVNNNAVSIATFSTGQQQQHNYNNNNKLIAQPTTATTTTKATTKLSNKYVLQQQQPQQQHQSLTHIATLPQGTQLQHKSGPHTYVQVANNIPSNAIKFVNAHGTVIQQHQPKLVTAAAATTTTVPGTRQQQHYTKQQQHQQHGEAANPSTLLEGRSGSKNIYHLTTSSVTKSTNQQQQQNQANVLQHQQQQQQQQSSSSTPTVSSSSSSSMITDDVMLVNGTQMTDEISARILQSMANKSFSNQQQRYHQQQQKTTSVNNTNMPPPTQQQTQQTIGNNSILLSPRDYTFYQHQNGVSPATTLSSSLPSPTSIQAAAQQYLKQTNAGGNTTYLSLTSTPSSSPSVSVSTHNFTSGGTTISPYMSATVARRQSISAPSSRAHSMERNKIIMQDVVARKSTEYFKTNNSNNSTSSSLSNLNTIRSNSNNNLSNNLTTTNNSSTVINTNSLKPLEQQQQQHQSIPVATMSASVPNLQNIKTMPSRLPPPPPPSSQSFTSSTTHSLCYEAPATPATNSSVPPPPALTPTVPNTAAAAAASPVIAATVAANITTTTTHTDEELFIEEVRPVPVNTQDLRLQLLHAILQDHTYASQQPPQHHQQHQHQATTQGGAANTQQWSLGGIGATVATTGGSTHPQPGSYTTFYGQQIPRHHQQDDDAHSAISTNSRLGLADLDPGEETETAAEAEAEDDSVTRCICDLTHDDGYMICCDKCSTWQHVDCMGIDRLNIPEEYLCQLCQPRAVDKTRARALQRQKRKEQQAQMLLVATQGAALASGGITTAAGMNHLVGGHNVGLQSQQQQQQQQQQYNFAGSGGNFSLGGSDAVSLQAFSASTGQKAGGSNGGPLHSTKKGKVLKKTKEPSSGVNKKTKKNLDKMQIAAAGGSLNQNSTTSGVKTGRKESKKSSKRKSKSGGDSSGAGLTAAEKHAQTLRQWIENYEFSVTNHYSPELRARLHAIQKQPSLLQSILNTENKALRNCGDLDNRTLVVPFTGTKVLISSQDITPNSPIIELRGKYLLTTQFRTQNPTVNMNTPPPSNYLNSFKSHKTPGQFIFFYQLPGVEAPMQTLNADGSYPHELPQPPPYLKGPEVCVDTRTYANDARFVRRSCRPNAEIQHYFEKGTLHLFIVALSNIRAQTEITIKHEPHDLHAVEQKKSNNAVVQPTSSKCACDMGNNCLFALPPSIQQQLATVGQPKMSRSKLAALNMNSAAAQQLTMGNLSNSLLFPNSATALAAAQRQQRQAAAAANNRNRSTSSSGESNIGLNSPNITQMNLGMKSSDGGIVGITAVTAAANSLLNGSVNSNSNNNNNNILITGNMNNNTSSTLLHDSGICTSSSSPSVSIPSPIPIIHSPTQMQQQLQHHSHHVLLSTTTTMATTSISSSVGVVKQQNVPQSPTQQEQQQHTPIMITMPPAAPIMLSPHLPSILPGQQQLPKKQQHQTLLQAQQQQQHNHQMQMLQQQQQQQQQLTLIASPSTTHPLSISHEQNIYVQPLLQHQLSKQHQQQQQYECLQNQQQQQEQQRQLAFASQEAQMAASALQTLHDSIPAAVVVPPKSESTNLPQQQQQRHSQQEKVAAPQTSIPATAPTKSTTSITPTAPTATNQVPTPTKSPQKSNSSSANNNSNHNNAHATTRKTPGKHARSSNSHSEDADNSTGGGAGESSSKPVSSTPKAKPKMSREDRKMEAILRAIEKMEKQDSRKKETKQTKRQNSQNNSPASPLGKRLNSSSDQQDITPNSTTPAQSTRKATMATRKKKRKASRSYSSPSAGGGASQRKRRKSTMINNDNDSDNEEVHAITSESEGTSMLSPAIQETSSSQNQTTNAAGTSVDNKPKPEEVAVYSSNSTTNDQAAGLLLALAQTNVVTPPELNHYAPSAANLTPSAPAITTVSSACLLIEAAMGPLAQLEGDNQSSQTTTSSSIALSSSQSSGEFKFPVNTKTKKTLMSNWFNQTESPTGDATIATTAASGLDSLVQAAMSEIKVSEERKQQEQQLCLQSPHQSQNLSIAALKVEEFIHQTEAGSPGGSGNSSNIGGIVSLDPYASAAAAAYGNESANHNVHLPIQVLTAANNSSVKKRWLRQAISEETDEHASNTSSAVNTPQSPSNDIGCFTSVNATLPNIVNGFSTPLKKRRLVINNNNGSCNQDDTNEDLNVEGTPPNLSPEQHQIEDNIGAASPKKEQQEDMVVDVVGGSAGTVEKYEIKHDCDTKSVINHDSVNQVHHESSIEQTIQSSSIALMRLKVETKYPDQDDDVDILRSPSPGGKIVAEDNLVKIEPEDTSGAADDVKIDVEREESQACDKFEEMFKIKQSEQDQKTEQQTVSEQEQPEAITSIDIVKKEEHKLTTDGDNNDAKNESSEVLVTEASSSVPKIEVKSDVVYVKQDKSNSSIKTEKSMKFEKHLMTTTKVEKHSSIALLVKPENQMPGNKGMTSKENTLVEPKPGDSLLRSTKAGIELKTDLKTESPEEPMRKKAKHDVSSSGNCSGISSSGVAAVKLDRKHNLERKNLTEHDIQERLLSFHAENISYLQSRNKKNKNNSGSSPSSSSGQMVKHDLQIGSSNSNNSNSGGSTNKAVKIKKEHKEGKHGKHVAISNSTIASSSSSSSSKKAHKKQRTKSASDKTAEKAAEKSDVVHKTNKNKPSLPSSSVVVEFTAPITNGKVSLASSSVSSGKATENNTLRRRTMSMCVPAAAAAASSSNHNSIITAAPVTMSTQAMKSNAAIVQPPTQTTMPSLVSKKRQTNFEQELTKSNPPAPILNSNSVSVSGSVSQHGATGNGKQTNHQHRKENRVEPILNPTMADIVQLAKISRRRESMCASKYQAQLLASAIKKEKSKDKREKKKSKKGKKLKTKSLSSPSSKTPLTTNSIVNKTVMAADDSSSNNNNRHHAVQLSLTPTSAGHATHVVKSTVVVTPQQTLHPLIPPHFNNVVSPLPLNVTTEKVTPQQNVYAVVKSTHPQQKVVASPIPIIAQPIAQSPVIAATNKTSQELTDAAPIPVVITQPVALGHVVGNNNPTPTKALPYFNTIYGKLQNDNQTSTGSIPSKQLPPPSLSEFLESSKSRTFVTLGSSNVAGSGGYGNTSTLISSTGTKRLVGVSNTNTLELTSSTTGNVMKASVPLVAVSPPINNNKINVTPPIAVSTVGTLSSAASSVVMPHLSNNGASTPIAPEMPPPTAPMKMFTRTASHDPRLNPMLSAPEPQPMPKRKLSISEYRMRMRPSTESGSYTPTMPSPSPFDSSDGFFQRHSLTTTSTKSSHQSSSVRTINKCSLDSPERYSVAFQRRNSINVQNNKNNNLSEKSPTSIGGTKSKNTAATTLSTVNNILNQAHRLKMFEDKAKGGQFNAAPTQLEQQQEKISERSRYLQRTISCDSRVIERLEKSGGERSKRELDYGVNLTRCLYGSWELPNAKCIEDNRPEFLKKIIKGQSSCEKKCQETQTTNCADDKQGPSKEALVSSSDSQSLPIPVEEVILLLSSDGESNDQSNCKDDTLCSSKEASVSSCDSQSLPIPVEEVILISSDESTSDEKSQITNTTTDKYQAAPRNRNKNDMNLSLETISSASTSVNSSRESSPEQQQQQRINTTTMTNKLKNNKSTGRVVGQKSVEKTN